MCLQAFLDVYTIREELGTVNGLTITMVGDLKNGRTVHSLVRLLSNYSVSINLVAPASLSMPDSVKNDAIKAGIPIFETTSLASVIGSTDVLYVTRVQQERFASIEEYAAVKDSYVINNELLSRAKPHCIVMHPLPRNAELDPEVDFDQRRAAFFRQMRYGMFVRLGFPCCMSRRERDTDALRNRFAWLCSLSSWALRHHEKPRKKARFERRRNFKKDRNLIRNFFTLD